MKFKNVYRMKATLKKKTIKEGIERDEELFNQIKPGEEMLITNSEIIGKDKDGKCYIKMITDWERFNDNEF